MRKVAILGTAETTVSAAPMEDTEWEIWGCAPRLFPFIQDECRFDRWYEIHKPIALNERYPEFVSRLAAAGSKTHALYSSDLWPDATIIPRDRILQNVMPYWLSSTPAWMLADALMEGDVGIVGLFGIEMSLGGEYEQQRPGMLHLMDVAAMMNVQVAVPRQSELIVNCLPYPENFENPYVESLVERERWNTEGQTKWRESLKFFEAERHKIEGRREYAERLGHQDEIEACDRQIKEIDDQAAFAKDCLNTINGRLEEVWSLLRRANIKSTDNEEARQL